MTDLTPTIEPKSDQLNADDLIAGPRTITVTKVMLSGAAEQPIAIHFEGDHDKPFKPCKSMRRVMVALWGPDGNAYAGRRMTLYRDAKVRFGGVEVGGIRISHMSHIDGRKVMALTESRASRKPFVVEPISGPQAADKGSAPNDTAARGNPAQQAEIPAGVVVHEFEGKIRAEMVTAIDPAEFAPWFNARWSSEAGKAWRADNQVAAIRLKADVAAKIAELKKDLEEA